MGHSNTAITSWCFVSIGVAQDEIWRSTLKYGSFCREIQQCVKCRQRGYTVTEYCVFLLPVDTDANVIFIHDDSKSDDMLLGHPWFPHY